MAHLAEISRREQGASLRFIKSVLGFFLRNMELQEAIQDATLFAGLLVNFLQKPQTVHRMYHPYERRHLLHFIGLQMPDEVPFDVGREQRFFFKQLLYPVLSENALPLIVQFLDPSHWLGFGNSDEGDVAGGELGEQRG